MARVGIDAETGNVLRGWPHCQQSIRKIVFTELGTRFQRRKFGSVLPRKIDDPQNEESVIEIYLGVAQALEPRLVEGHQYGEPGFVLLQARLDATVPGEVVLELGGVFFENGHLGDFSAPSMQSLSIPFTQMAA